MSPDQELYLWMGKVDSTLQAILSKMDATDARYVSHETRIEALERRNELDDHRRGTYRKMWGILAAVVGTAFTIVVALKAELLLLIGYSKVP